MELWKYLSSSLIVIIQRFQWSFHVQFSWCPDLYILFEKLTEQIGVWLGLGTLIRFEAPNDLRANIKTKWLISG